MRFAIHHHTRYGYDAPVELGPHVLRLCPRPEGIRLRARELRISPEPYERRETGDAFGNRVTELRFAGRCRELVIDSVVDLDTLEPPEVETSAVPLPRLPWTIDGGDELAAYQAPEPADPEVRRFAEVLAADVDHAPLAFLDRLTRTLHTRIDRGIRPRGDAQPAAETLASGRGACRDLAVLFMEVARCLGMASRFVSGYQAHAETVDGRRHLHAWPEVFVPGIGFRAWDPTHGVRVREGHVALCAAPTQAATMPVEGGYGWHGPAVASTLDFSLRIDAE